MPEKIHLTFLGTGSMVPTPKRNHPGFLLRYKGENILIDCGEGTQTQLRKAKLNPCKITKILITHWHGDHTFGLPGLLRTLSTSGYGKTLEIYGPYGFKKHMKEMFKAFGEIEEFKIKVEEISNPGKFFDSEDFYLEAEKMVHVQPCNAYNFVLKDNLKIDKKKLNKYKIKPGKHLQELKEGKDIKYEGKKYKAKDLTFVESGKKISFVLDTLENKRIAKFVKNADVLICESTFDSNFNDLAKAYKHLTSEQAAKIAKKAKVKKLYLVHLSDRYRKDSKSVFQEAKKIFKSVELPKDLEKIEV